MKILVTGGTGFIGSHLVHELIKENHQIILLKRSSSDLWRVKQIINRIRLVNLDKVDDIGKIFVQTKIDAVIHLATHYIKNDSDVSKIELMVKTNVVLPSLILDECKKHNVKIFINTGTCFEYRTKKGKTRETDKKEALNLYAATKLAFEEILKYYCKKGPMRGATLKLFYPYGEKDHDKLIVKVIDALINNKKLELTKGDQKLDYTYIDDIISAYIKTLKKLVESKVNCYDIFNIGSGSAIAIKKVITKLKKLHGKESSISLGKINYSSNEIMYIEADNFKAQEILGWKPKFTIDRGLKKTYDYYVNNYSK